jgi:threonyl-tRNA synthetase
MKEVEERSVSIRRLGETQTETQALADAVAAFAAEATPPDLR